MNDLKEIVTTLEEFLANMSDEEISAAAPELLKKMGEYYSSEEASRVITEMLEQADLLGYSPELVINEINAARDLILSAVAEVAEKYKDSPVKLSFLESVQEQLETLFSSATLYTLGRDNVTVGVELIHPSAKLPTYAHEGDQGADIYAIEDTIIEPFTFGNMVPTGLKLKIPHGWAVSIRPRSGLSKNTPLRISNSPATIDQQYRGEVKILFDNFSSEPIEIKAGERIAQFVLEKNYPANWKEVEFVDAATDRAEGGFGSSGK